MPEPRRDGHAGNRVLITVSGTIRSAANGTTPSPRIDYLELARGLGADLLDHPTAREHNGRFGAVLERFAGKNGALAWRCYRVRRRYDVIFTDGEQVGLPFAALCWLSRPSARARHLMIGHVMSTAPKRLLMRALVLRRRIDAWIVYSSSQRRILIDELGVEPSTVTRLPFMVDSSFFDPALVEPALGRTVICSAGLELRDYPTLVAATRDLDVDVVIAAASPWSKRSNELAAVEVPSNVTTTRLDLHQLRQLYADAAIVVMPLKPTDFQAGITTILEAMSMARAIVCTKTQGQDDTIVDGVTGVYVPPGDPRAMRAAIAALIADPARATQLGATARSWVVEHADIEVYVAAVASVVDRLRPG